MSLTIHDLPVAENIGRASMNWHRKGLQVQLDNDSRRRNQRRWVKLHERGGRYFIIDRLYGKRFIKAIRVLAIDGKLLENGTAVLEKEEA